MMLMMHSLKSMIQHFSGTNLVSEKRKIWQALDLYVQLLCSGQCARVICAAYTNQYHNHQFTPSTKTIALHTQTLLHHDLLTRPDRTNCWLVGTITPPAPAPNTQPKAEMLYPGVLAEMMTI